MDINNTINHTIKELFERKSVRVYTDEPVAGEAKELIIQAAMEEAGAYYKEISDAELDGYRSTLEEKGMVFVEPNDVQEWKDAVNPMYEEYAVGYEDLLQAIIDAQ